MQPRDVILDVRTAPEQPDRSQQLRRVGRLNRQQERRQVQDAVAHPPHQGHAVGDLTAGAEHQHGLATVHPHLPDHAAHQASTGDAIVDRPAQLNDHIAGGAQQSHVVPVLDGALLHVDDPQVISQGVVPDDDFVLPEGECRLDTVSVLPRRRAHRVPHREGGIAQRILQVRPHQPRLVLQLRRIREVLPLAASTHAEVPARGGRGVSGLPHQ